MRCAAASLFPGRESLPRPRPRGEAAGLAKHITLLRSVFEALNRRAGAGEPSGYAVGDCVKSGVGPALRRSVAPRLRVALEPGRRGAARPQGPVPLARAGADPSEARIPVSLRGG